MSRVSLGLRRGDLQALLDAANAVQAMDVMLWSDIDELALIHADIKGAWGREIALTFPSDPKVPQP